MTIFNRFLDSAPVLSCESKNGGCARNDGVLDSRLRGNDKGTDDPCFAKASQGRLHSGVPAVAF